MLPKEHTAYAERYFHIARISRKRNRGFDPIFGKVYAQIAISSIVCFVSPGEISCL
jgi:hypothetical protein